MTTSTPYQSIAAELSSNCAAVRKMFELVSKGDTANAGTKEAVMETGLKVQVPLFIDSGEAIRVSTETGEYVERA